MKTLPENFVYNRPLYHDYDLFCVVVAIIYDFLLQYLLFKEIFWMSYYTRSLSHRFIDEEIPSFALLAMSDTHKYRINNNLNKSVLLKIWIDLYSKTNYLKGIVSGYSNYRQIQIKNVNFVLWDVINRSCDIYQLSTIVWMYEFERSFLYSM